MILRLPNHEQGMFLHLLHLFKFLLAMICSFQHTALSHFISSSPEDIFIDYFRERGRWKEMAEKKERLRLRWRDRGERKISTGCLSYMARWGTKLKTLNTKLCALTGNQTCSLLV